MSTIHTSIVLADNISGALLSITNAMNCALNTFGAMQTAGATGFELSGVDRAREALADATIQAKKFEEALNKVRSPQIAPTWNIQSQLEIFQNTGTARLNSEMSSLDNLTQMVLRSQRQINDQALNMNILPPNASWDINETQKRIEALNQKLTTLQTIDVNLLDDASTQRLNSEFEAIRSSMNSIVNLQEQMNTAIGSGDISQLNAGYNQLNNIAEQVERRVRETAATISGLNNIQWTTPQNIEIFQSSGITRYNQEIQSANTMMSNVVATQQQISTQAASMNILPPNAVNDITGLRTRVLQLQQQLQRIEQTGLDDIGANQASRDVEQLRERLNQAIQSQNQLNDALQRMDVSAANDAYNRLNSIINETDRNIRDNINAQNDFNNRINQGTNAMDGLQKKVMAVAAAYTSVQGLKMTMNLSDQSVQTEARLGLIVDDNGTAEQVQGRIDELQDRIFASSIKTGSSFQRNQEIVAKLGIQARAAFGNNDELIAFSEQLNKHFSIAGTSALGIESVMYNLTQALSSGVLRGQDLNAVLGNTPSILQNVADYLDVDIGKIREIAADGELSAQVVKNAVLSAMSETDARFAKMPLTFAAAMENIKSYGLRAFEPVLKRINEGVNSVQFQTLAQNIISVLVVVSSVVMTLFDVIGGIAQFASDNWSILAPIILGAAAAWGVYSLAVNWATISIKAHMLAEKAAAIATGFMTAAKWGAVAVLSVFSISAATAAAAQCGLNGAMLANPVGLVIMGIVILIALFYAVVAAINKFTGTSVSATGIIAGAFMVLVTHIYNNIAYLWNIFASIAEFWVNVWKNPMYSVKKYFGDLVKDVLNMLISFTSGWDEAATNMANAMIDGINRVIRGLNWLIDKLNSIPFLDLQIGGIAEFQHTASITTSLQNTKIGIDEWLGPMPDDYWQAPKLEMKSLAEAFDTGYNWGQNIEEKFSNMLGEKEQINDYANMLDSSMLAGDVSGINDNTGSMKDAMNASEEDLKYMRDIAERDVINRFTTAKINVSFGDINNNVSKDTDLDGIVTHLEEYLTEKLEAVAEGVYA